LFYPAMAPRFLYPDQISEQASWLPCSSSQPRRISAPKRSRSVRWFPFPSKIVTLETTLLGHFTRFDHFELGNSCPIQSPHFGSSTSWKKMVVKPTSRELEVSRRRPLIQQSLLIAAQCDFQITYRYSSRTHHMTLDTVSVEVQLATSSLCPA
jgi:hypothetical protein